jgi:hypothetical protein
MKRKREKLSAIIVAMAETIITRPVDNISEEAATASLILSTEAWNQEIDLKEPSKGNYLTALKQLEKRDKKFHIYLKSTDYAKIIMELRDYKRSHFSDDKRKIRTFEMTEKGNIRVVWEEN